MEKTDMARISVCTIVEDLKTALKKISYLGLRAISGSIFRPPNIGISARNVWEINDNFISQSSLLKSTWNCPFKLMLEIFRTSSKLLCPSNILSSFSTYL